VGGAFFIALKGAWSPEFPAFIINSIVRLPDCVRTRRALQRALAFQRFLVVRRRE
jgi:hypothetical protein